MIKIRYHIRIKYSKSFLISLIKFTSDVICMCWEMINYFCRRSATVKKLPSSKDLQKLDIDLNFCWFRVNGFRCRSPSVLYLAGVWDGQQRHLDSVNTSRRSHQPTLPLFISLAIFIVGNILNINILLEMS